ncbi:hypothetical protein QT381_04780 [Galbitalea sp. SE-J8]|uniref:hypothetical protein n=1 Tax=Galbitalea sp. SE-J8 TaxID=3054952 RepID=UPI00259CC514|nr:hypothetical protein [Galbitalea sp. SE-J8]MDM4762319.1 hypothetical protein [Galbitalea sp. SE-J8]
MTTLDPLTEAARLALRVGVEAQQGALALAQGRLEAALAALPRSPGASWRGPASAGFARDLAGMRTALGEAARATSAAHTSGWYTTAWLDE